MAQVRTGMPATITTTFYGDEGETPAVVAAVTVHVVDSTGADIIAADTAATQAGTGWEFTLPAQTDLDLLTVTWSGTLSGNDVTQTTTVEIIAGHYFELAELRARRTLRDNDQKYPTARLVEAREWITELVESACDTSFVERFHTQIVERFPTGVTIEPRIRLADAYPISLLGVTLDGTDLTNDDLASLHFAHGILTGPAGHPIWNSSWRRAVIRYTAGYCAIPGYAPSVPGDLREAMLSAARDHVLGSVTESAISERVTTISTPDGSQTLATPGRGSSITGLPGADEVIARWADAVRVPAIG